MSEQELPPELLIMMNELLLEMTISMIKIGHISMFDVKLARDFSISAIVNRQEEPYRSDDDLLDFIDETGELIVSSLEARIEYEKEIKKNDILIYTVEGVIQ